MTKETIHYWIGVSVAAFKWTESTTEAELASHIDKSPYHAKMMSVTDLKNWNERRDAAVRYWSQVGRWKK